MDVYTSNKHALWSYFENVVMFFHIMKLFMKCQVFYNKPENVEYFPGMIHLFNNLFATCCNKNYLNTVKLIIL